MPSSFVLLWRSVEPVRFNPFEEDFLYIPNINLVLKMEKNQKTKKNPTIPPWTGFVNHCQDEATDKFPRPHSLWYYVCVLSCSVVSDSLQHMDCSPLGSSVHGIFQVRILEWVAISSSRGSSRRPWTKLVSPALAGGFFTTWVTWEAPMILWKPVNTVLISPGRMTISQFLGL